MILLTSDHHSLESSLAPKHLEIAKQLALVGGANLLKFFYVILQLITFIFSVRWEKIRGLAFINSIRNRIKLVD